LDFIPHPDDLAFQHAGQQDLVTEQPSRCSLKQYSRALGPRPTHGVEPAIQTELHERIREMPVAVVLSYLFRVFPALFTGTVRRKLLCVLKA
jgi:hypothetical protein